MFDWLHTAPRQARRHLAGTLSRARTLTARMWIGTRPGPSPLLLAGLPAGAGNRLGAAQIRDLVARLQAQKPLLLSFTERLEEEYLRLGSALQAMDQRARGIERQYDRIHALTSGQGEDAPLQFSFQLLKKAEDLVFSCYDQYERVFGIFRDLADKLAGAISQQNRLQRILAMLPLIVVQLRVQTSAFDDQIRQPFFTLADEISALLEQIRASVNEQFIALWETRTLSATLVEDLAVDIQKHKTEIQKTLDNSRDRLQTLSRALTHSSQVVQDMSLHSQGVSADINQIIMALQCQDITRQKIQHVAQAVDEMVAHLEEAAAGPRDPGTMADLRRFVGEAALIQGRQIKTVFEENEKAAGQIAGGMRGLQDAAARLAEGALRTGQVALESDVLRQSVQSLRDMLSMVKITTRKTEAIRQSIAPLQRTFATCTKKISALAQGVRRAALNAQVFAAPVVGGAVLEVLAEQTRAISDQTLGAVERLEAHLEEMSAAIDFLRQELGDFQELALQEQDLLVAEAIPCEAKLGALQQELPETIRQIGPEQQELIALVEQGAGQTAFPEIVAAARLASLPFFEALSDWGRPTDPAHGQSAAVEERLDRLRDNYTMAHERDIHEDSLKNRAHAPTLPLPMLAATLGVTDGAASHGPPGDAPQAPLAPAGTSSGSPEPGVGAAPAIAPAGPDPNHEIPAPVAAEVEKKEDLGDNVELF